MEREMSARQILGRAAGLYRPYRWRVAGVAALVVITVLLEVGVPLASREVIDVGWSSSPPVLFALGGLAAVLVVAARGCRYAFYSSGRGIGKQIVLALSEDVYGRLAADVDLEYHEQQLEPGEAYALAASDVGAVEGQIKHAWSSSLYGVVLFVVSLVALWSVQPFLTVGIVVLLPVLALSLRALVARFRALGREERRCERRLAARVEDLALEVLVLLRLYGFEDELRALFHVAADGLQRVRIKIFDTTQLQGTTIIAFSSLAIIVLYVLEPVGSQLFGWPRLSVGSVIAYTALIGQLISPIQQLIEQSTNIAQALPHLERLFAVQDEPVSTRSAGELQLDTVQRSVGLDNVTFAYKTPDGGYGDPVLRDITAQFRLGEWHAIIGSSGSGKSSMLGVLTGLRRLDPIPGRIAGSVLVDGQDRTGLSRTSRSRLFALVPQNAAPRGETILDALLADAPTARAEYQRLNPGDAAADDRDQVIRAILGQAVKLACLEDVIAKRGYHGKTAALSGGQRQRLAIAAAALRILARDAQILLLDEGVSQLDPETALAVRDRLHEWAQAPNPEDKITVIEITHQFPQTRADTITGMADGQIAEHGTHDELRHADGPYQRLVDAATT